MSNNHVTARRPVSVGTSMFQALASNDPQEVDKDTNDPKWGDTYDTYEHQK